MSGLLRGKIVVIVGLRECGLWSEWEKGQILYYDFHKV